jgi:hypothetical protein
MSWAPPEEGRGPDGTVSGAAQECLRYFEQCSDESASRPRYGLGIPSLAFTLRSVTAKASASAVGGNLSARLVIVIPVPAPLAAFTFFRAAFSGTFLVVSLFRTGRAAALFFFVRLGGGHGIARS